MSRENYLKIPAQSAIMGIVLEKGILLQGDTSMTASYPMVHDRNQQKILEAIIQEDAISRADLSKRLGLTKATISSQVQGLLDLGLVEEIGSLATSKGRRPILLRFCGSCRRALAIDITPTDIRAMQANLLGQQCTLLQWDWDGKPDTLTALLKKLIQRALSEGLPFGTASPQGSSAPPLAGISLGIHGVVHEDRILFTPYYQLEGMPLKELLMQEFGLPIYLGNEANLSALGECTFSSGAASLINISIHSGIGLGIVMNGRLYLGDSGFAGEFGHTVVEPGGLPCPCGNLGCIEQYASIDAVLRNYNQLKDTRHSTIDDLVAGCQRQEGAALAAVADFVKYMAIGINNIVNIFNPQLVVLNSLLTAYLPDVVPRIQQQLKNPMSRGCTIVSSTLQDTATLLGGIAVCARQFLGIEDFRPVTSFYGKEP